MEIKTFINELNSIVKTKLNILRLDYLFDEITCDLDEIDLSCSEKEILKNLCLHLNGELFYFGGSDEDAAEIFQNESEESISLEFIILEALILETISQIKRRLRGGVESFYEIN